MKQLFIFFLFSLFISSSFAQWNTDSSQRNPICVEPNLQDLPLLCTDGHSGAIIAWEDERNGTKPDVYVQHIDTNGIVKWTANGIPLSLADTLFGTDEHYIVSDNAGGAIIFFEITVNGGADHIYAQHIDATGKELWQKGGVPVSITNDSRLRDAEDPGSNQAASDGEGGAFVTWQEYGPFANYIQHIDKNGNALWGTNGESVTSTDSAGGRYKSAIINAGGGTAVLAFSYYPRLYLQRVNANGSYMWGNGVRVADSAYNNNSYQDEYLVFDSLSPVKNIMVSWEDVRNGNDIYAQKVDINGNIIWQKNGIAIAATVTDEYAPDMVADKSGGFFIIYDSSFTGKVQHVNSSGQLLWGTGKDVSSISTASNLVICDDGSTGIIAAWHDGSGRNGTGNYGEAVFAQHFDGSGTALWRINGIPVINDLEDINHTSNPILSTGSGGAIVSWSDERKQTPGDDDIYAAKVGGTDGVLPLTLLSFTGAALQNKVLLNWASTQEVNTNYFVVEKSADGVHFSTFMQVRSNNKNNITNYYSATDNSPINGINYYRLREVNKDGTFVNSKIVSVNLALQAVTSLYPNPAKDFIKINIVSSFAKTISISLYDISGKLLLVKQMQLMNGSNAVTINVSQYSKGVYTVRSKEISFEQKIVIQ